MRSTNTTATTTSAGHQANSVDLTAGNYVSDEAEFNQVTHEEDQALEVIYNLATTSATDKSTIATLASTNAYVVKALASSRRELSTLKPYENSEKSRKHYCWSCGANCNQPRYL